jgi:hypothetical protein
MSANILVDSRDRYHHNAPSTRSWLEDPACSESVVKQKISGSAALRKCKDNRGLLQVFLLTEYGGIVPRTTVLYDRLQERGTDVRMANKVYCRPTGSERFATQGE